MNKVGDVRNSSQDSSSRHLLPFNIPEEESNDECHLQTQSFRSMLDLNQMGSPSLASTSDSDSNQSLKSDDDTLYCGPCKREFSRKDNYRQHRKTVHNNELRSHIKISSPVIILPDEKDPNFYCRTCKKTFSQWPTYRSHLQKAHEMALVPTPSPSKIFLLPNQKYDHRFTCCQTCGRYFSSKIGYTQHLKRAHQITLSVPNPHLMPDPNDPDFYCRACEINSISKYAYRYHLKKTHKMTFRKKGYLYHLS